MASDVDICNLALGHLGDEATVSDIEPSDGSPQADHCARFYPVARNALLERHAWGFATKRVVLAEVDNELDSWGYAYALPSQCLKPLSVLNPESTDDNDTEDFIIETDVNGTEVLYTNVEEATLRYISLVTDTTKFTPLFTVALARLLASYLGGPIIKGETGMKIARAQLTWFEEVDFPKATASNANAGQSNPYTSSTPAGITSRA